MKTLESRRNASDHLIVRCPKCRREQLMIAGCESDIENDYEIDTDGSVYPEFVCMGHNPDYSLSSSTNICGFHGKIKL